MTEWGNNVSATVSQIFSFARVLFVDIIQRTLSSIALFTALALRHLKKITIKNCKLKRKLVLLKIRYHSKLLWTKRKTTSTLLFICNSTNPFYFKHSLLYAVCSKMDQACFDTPRNARFPSPTSQQHFVNGSDNGVDRDTVQAKCLVLEHSIEPKWLQTVLMYAYV